jgi:hypothetical protein
MNIYTVELKNQPGELARLCEVLGRSGVNVELSAGTTRDHGTVFFTTSDEPATTAALHGAGIGYTEHPALQVVCADRAGEAAKFAHKLANAEVNIEWLLPVTMCHGEAVYAVSVDKIDEARTALAGQVF